MQQIWCLLLNDAFMNTYTQGIIITCGDKVKQWVFPQFFTYAADYLEKYVLFTSEQKFLISICYGAAPVPDSVHL